jgi:hypothetical protein
MLPRLSLRILDDFRNTFSKVELLSRDWEVVSSSPAPSSSVKPTEDVNLGTDCTFARA